MAKLPALYLMTGDWMKNPELRRCSPGARGVWIDMLCLMFDCEKRGVLATGGSAWSLKEIANAVSGDTNLVLSHIEELLQKQVARMDDQSGNATGTPTAIYSGRMLRDEKERQRWQQSKHNTRRNVPGMSRKCPGVTSSTKHNNIANEDRDCPGDVPPDVPAMSRPSSLSSSLTKQNPKAPPHPPPGGAAFVLPDWVPKDAWNAWIEMRIRKRNRPTLRAMELAISRLVTLQAEGYSPDEVLEEATFRGWTGLFAPNREALKGGMGHGTRGINRAQERADATKAAAQAAAERLGLASGNAHQLSLGPSGDGFDGDV